METTTRTRIKELSFQDQKKKKKKKRTCRPLWVKILKIMPQSQSPFSPRKGRDTLRQKVQIFRLKYSLA